MKTREYPNRPIVGVGVCVLEQDSILLIKRGNSPRMGSWSLPGGAQKIGETCRECAIREIKEETGINISILSLIDTIDSITYDFHGAIRYHYTLIDYLAQHKTGELIPSSDAVDARWFRRSDLAEIDLWSETNRIINKSFEIYNNLTSKK